MAAKKAKKKATRKAKRTPRKPKKSPKPRKLPAPRRKRRPKRIRKSGGSGEARSGCSVKVVIFCREDLPEAPNFVDTQVASASVSRGDKVFWFNSTGTTFTLSFNGGAGDWPFNGAKQDILVPAYGNSTAFFVARLGKFSYRGVPHLDGPPADPVIDAGD